MSARNRFLQGSFAPVSKEITAFDLPVTGRVPAELSGRYLRNGPNPLGLDDPNYHWFLGAGMVHGVRLRDGKAEWYRNRWVRSRAVAQALGETWPGGPVHDGMDFAANTHIISHCGRTLATVEAGPLPYELSGELETRGPCDFGGTLPGGFAAHTKADPRTGELHAIAYYWAWDHVQHVIVDGAGKVSRTTDIPVTDGPMMHDFALTENYVVFFDLPVTFSMDAVSAGRELPYTWNPAHQARVGLLPRSGSSAGGRAVAGDRPLLGLPHAQRLRGRRAGGGRSLPVSPAVRRRNSLGQPRRRDPGPVDDRPGCRHGQPADPQRPRAGIPPRR